MKYIISESQNEGLKENILKIPFIAVNNDWDFLQSYLEKKGNPPYALVGRVELNPASVLSLGNLRFVYGDLIATYCKMKTLGNLLEVHGFLDLYSSKILSLGSLRFVKGDLDLRKSSLSNHAKTKPYNEVYLEIYNTVKVGGDIYI